MSAPNVSIRTAASWQDGKRYWWLLSPALPLLGVCALGLYQFTGASLWLWTGPFLLYGLIPLLDRLIGTDRTNPPESAVAALEDDRYYRAIVYAYIPAQLLLTIWGAVMVASGSLSLFGIVGLIMTVGTINGIGINTAHELGHKTGKLERWLARLTLAPVAYGHFFVEHNKGHHKNVATPEDPASSKMGETFWQFLPRTVVGSVRSGWAIEKARLARKGESVWSLDNEVLQAWAMTVVLFGGLTAVLGWSVLPFLLLQAAFGAALLEVVNYIEHYGLLRQMLPSGRYERCTPAHSWNSNHVVTNLFLYQLQRHSDHHANPTRRFQALRHFDESPQLPSGYASMMLVAYIPWLWFRQMDPLVVQHHNGDLSRANLHPAKRQQLLRRWQSARLDDGQPTVYPQERQATRAAASANEARYDTVATADLNYRCTDCGYIYDERQGCPDEGYPAGTPWAAIPEDWACPCCAVRDKVDFVAVERKKAA